MVTISCKILYQEIRNHIFCLISKIISFFEGYAGLCAEALNMKVGDILHMKLELS